MARVSWTDSAKEDLSKITLYWLRTTGDPQATARNVGILLRDVKRLAETPLLDRKHPDLIGDKRRWYYVKDTEYLIFYERIGPKTIQVVMLWPSRGEPLDFGTVP